MKARKPFGINPLWAGLELIDYQMKEKSSTLGPIGNCIFLWGSNLNTSDFRQDIAKNIFNLIFALPFWYHYALPFWYHYALPFWDHYALAG